jgi:hypothetical protein
MGTVLYFSDLHGPPRPALSNPFATRHMWRTAVYMWRMKISSMAEKFNVFGQKHKFPLGLV